MDELRNFFNNPSKNKVVLLRGPQTHGVCLTSEDLEDKHNRKEEHRHTVLMTGTDYAREVKEREIQNYMKSEMEREGWASVSGGLESLEQLSMWGMSQPNLGELSEEAMTEVYSKYSFQVKEDSNNLAINDYKQKILNAINGQPVIIIEGPTGCGKTTQVPQWILDDCYQKRKHCKIVVTQPRRIAATSIAKRVAAERGWDLGGLVGYQVGLDSKISNDTRIHYVTTGVLLQKLVSAKNLGEYTHIVLDEVHERGQEMDFLLLIVKKLLYTVSPNVKVILMSATFNYEAFASYFMIPTPRGFEKSSWIKVVKNKRMFTVKTFYLNHLQKFGNVLQAFPQSQEPAITSEMYQLVIKLVNAFELIDKQEDNYTDDSDVDVPSVLMFLPGINEIEELYKCLMDLDMRMRVAGPECAKYKWFVLPLHSTITTDEQIRVFQRAPPGHRKIILSTNIAESSITVPDIKYVVDFCLMKILVADDKTNFTSLQLQWASKTNCEQRAGRAGRVRDGRVYRLVTDKFYDQLSQECAPEIRRCPLERLVLLAKMLDMGPPSDILALAMDPPDMSNIMRTTLVLKEIGGLKKTVDGEICKNDGDITYLGRIMAKLPLDVRASKLIMLGHIFGCLHETIIMAAAMTVKDIFNTPFKERLNAYNSKLTWADGSCSDCIAYVNAYKVWSHLRQQQYFKQQGHNEQAWARRFYVQVRYLRELDDLVRELKNRLSREGIESTNVRSPWAKHEEPLIWKVLIAGAFYPHYFVQIGSSENRERDAVKTLGGLDPRTTVYLKDFPLNQPGPIYAGAIKNIVKQLIHDEPRVTFDLVGSKVFLSFDEMTPSSGKEGDGSRNPTIPGKVVLPVYKSVKARQLRMDIRLNMLPADKATVYGQALEMSKLTVDTDKMVPRLPEIDDQHIPITISQFVNCGRFWVQYDDESTASDLRQISAALNKRPLLAHTGNVDVGEIYAAPYQENGYFRVRVQKMEPKDMILAFYIDFGMVTRIHASSLRVLPSGVCRELPPLAMECALAEIAPSAILEAHARWTREATNFFAGITQKKPLVAKVYSVSHGLVAIELFADGGKTSVNQALIKRGYAKPSDESYDSKVNHDLRETAADMNLAQKRAFNRQQLELAWRETRDNDLATPDSEQCYLQHHLKGPFSPLESSIHNLMYASREKQVIIEWNSVNSVILDTEPQEIYERLVVAGIVGTNEESSKLTLRHTTVMPNIPALPAIIALLFAPNAELRRDPTCSHYVSVLCGLGPLDDAPMFPEHDLLVNIDAHISVLDIENINYIRLQMDYMMYCAPGQDAPSVEDVKLQVPFTIREKFMELITKPRKRHESLSVEYAWDWNTAPVEDILELTDPDLHSRAVIYPLHSPLELRERTAEELLELKKENDKLVELVKKTPLSSNRDVQCKLCSSEVMTTQAMRIHLQSRGHRENEEDFRIFES